MVNFALSDLHFLWKFYMCSIHVCNFNHSTRLYTVIYICNIVICSAIHLSPNWFSTTTRPELCRYPRFLSSAQKRLYATWKGIAVAEHALNYAAANKYLLSYHGMQARASFTGKNHKMLKRIVISTRAQTTMKRPPASWYPKRTPWRSTYRKRKVHL